MSAETVELAETDFRALALRLASVALEVAGFIDPDVETTIGMNAYGRGAISILVHEPAPMDTAATLAKRIDLRAYRLCNGYRHEWSGTIDGFAAQVNWLEPKDDDQ